MGWWSRAVSAVKSAVNKAVSTVKSVVKTVSSSVSKAVSSAKSAVSKVASSVKSSVSNSVRRASSAVSSVANTVKNTAAEVVDKISDKIENVKDTIKDTASKSIDNVKDKIENVKDTIKEKVEEVIEKIIIPVPPAETSRYWTLQGYTIEEAVKLAKWSRENKRKPTDEEIKEILKKEPPTLFAERWGRMIEHIKNRRWMAAGIAAVSLTTAFVIPEDEELLIGIVPISPAPVGISPSILAKLGPKVTVWGNFVQILKNLALSAKANPLIAIFASTEYLQMGLLSVFAFKWLASQKGETLIGVSVTLGSLQKEFDSAGFDFTEAVKRGDMIAANEIKIKMENLVLEYKELIETKKDVLIEGGEYEARKSIGELMEAIMIKMRRETLELELPEIIRSTVRDIIDGDTIDVSLDAKNQETEADIKLPEYATTGHARIRIVGINAPEKSPKGEILCSDVEIFSVEKEWADNSRDRLLPLNDKEVILKIDPETPVDTHNRILAVVEHNEEDIGLRQINEGLACGYYREPHKYYDEGEYSDATLTAKDEGIGMWKGLEEIEKEEDKIKIIITSTPTNAKLFLDDVSLHHNTPSDEAELSDVMHLFTLGAHVLSAEKAGLSAMEDIEIVKGDNGTIHLDLVTEPFPGEIPPTEETDEEIIANMENHIFERADEVESMVENILDVTMIRPPKIFVGKVFEILAPGVTAVHRSADNSIRFSESYWLDVYKKNPKWYLRLEGVFAHELTHEIQGQVIGIEEFVEIYRRDRTEMEDLANAVESKVEIKDVTSIWPFKGLTEEEWFAGVAPPEEIPVVVGPVKPAEIPAEYTDEQVWALKEAFDKILILTEGGAIMSGEERENLINSFNLYTDGQKQVLELLWKDLFFYTEGVKQLSADEFILLKEKYRMI